MQINKEATQLTVETTDMGVGGRASTSKNLKQRNKAAIASLAETLSNAQLKIPDMLLTSSIQILTEKAEKGQVLISSVAIHRMPSLAINSV